MDMANSGAAGTGTTGTGSGPTAAQVNEKLQSALGTADTTSAAAVQNLTMVHQARVSHLTRTAATLKAQLGASDPAVIAAEAAVQAGNARVARLAVVQQQILTPDPQVAANGWALQGRVFDANQQPAGALTVFLVDAQKNFEREFGYAYTDNTGYFLINYGGPENANSQARNEQAEPLFVEITNEKQQPIYLGTAPFQPAAGSTTYLNITLAEGRPPIGEPPPGTRGGSPPESD